jgi:hypothetical protein
MSESREVNVLNLHEYLRYDLTNATRRMAIMWDGSDHDVKSLIMKDTFIGNDDYYANALWVNVVKQLLNWEEGTTLDITIQEYHDLNKIIISQSMSLWVISTNFRIDEDGYLCRNRVSIPNNQNYIRCNCLYNDLLDEENHPYILK